MRAWKRGVGFIFLDHMVEVGGWWFSRTRHCALLRLDFCFPLFFFCGYDEKIAPSPLREETQIRRIIDTCGGQSEAIQVDGEVQREGRKLSAMWILEIREGEKEKKKRGEACGGIIAKCCRNRSRETTTHGMFSCLTGPDNILHLTRHEWGRLMRRGPPKGTAKAVRR